MPIERRQVARHILIPDTNMLWHEDKSFCVAPKFQDFLDHNSNQYDIDLVLPSVVFGELLFQQTTSALSALRKVNSEFVKMSAVAAANYAHRIRESRVRSDVERKLRAWIASNNCQIVETPTDDIDWNRLINDAIWREPPFVEDKKTEKGFRDSLIVETAVHVATINPDIDVAFVSGDRLVRDSAQSRLGDRCTCYETIEEFETFLKLSEEELTNEFVKAILVRARVKFHKEGDGDCLLYREELVTKIKDQFSDKLLPPLAGLQTPDIFAGSTPRTNRWEATTNESVWIRAPQFVSLEGDNEYHWTSRVIFVQMFKFEGTRAGGLLGGYTEPGEEKLRKVEFEINWKARVAVNGSFRSVEFENFGESETIFEPITEAEREHYSIGTENRESS